MRIRELFSIWLGAVVALGSFADAGGAERLQSIVRRVSAAEAPTSANSTNTFRLAGTVVDAEGNPVAGALVECYQSDNMRPPLSGAETEAKERVTTDATGAFDFRLPSVSTVLFARKPGLAPAWTQYRLLTKDRTEERLPLTAATTVSGVVVDEADKPVANAEVWVCYACCERRSGDGRTSWAGYFGGKPLRDCLSARTTAEGKFVIQGFPAETAADLAVSTPGKALREQKREYLGPDTMCCQAGQQDVRLVVEQAGSVAGKVVAKETGQPVAGMKLSLRSIRPGSAGSRHNEPAQSDADGTFRLADVAAGTYELHATSDTNAAAKWVAESVPVTVEAGQTASDVKVSAQRGGVLEVAVLNKNDHQPIPQASIYAYKKGYQGGGSSGTDGLAQLRLPAGKYTVSASKDNSRSEGKSATVEGGSTNRIELELSPPPKVVGIVRDPSGAAVPGLRLALFPYWGPFEGDVQTDANGRYELPWDPQRMRGMQGTPCVIARDQARNLAVVQELEEGVTTLDLKLEPALAVAGRVEGAEGKALSNATVQVHLMLGNMGRQLDDKPATTDGKGHFEITALPPGRRCILMVNAKGYGSANKNLSEAADTNRVELEPFVLQVADRKLAGQVVDAEGKPVARANIHMYGQGQPNDYTRTDAQGRFKFDAVCEGSIQVSANAQRAYGSTRAQAGDTNVVVTLGTRESYTVSEAPQRPSLKGKPLPDLAALDLGADAVPAGKPVLLCLFDIEQRPSRRFARTLAEQHDALKQKGLTVIGLQAAVTPAESLKEWKQANPLPFPLGRIAEKSDKTKWVAEVDSLPWLILTDGQGRVAAEGFALDELEAKLTALPKPKQ
jgi:uncharacterized GH25 family protein